ncbi:MAG TPA: response regulator transcription factor [Jatrophihabitantaceae bacterium]
MRVILAEDSVLLREGLARLLVEADIEVTHAVGDADTLLAAVEAQPPDVVVTDIRMPPTFADEGLTAALTIRDRYPKVGVLVLRSTLRPLMPNGCYVTAPPGPATCSKTGSTT